MSQSDHQPEDVASLFKKFGGDAQRYREFADPDAPLPGAPVWALVPTPAAAGAASVSAEPALPNAPATHAEVTATVPSRPAPPTAVSALWPALSRLEPSPVQPPQPQPSVRPMHASASVAPVAAGTRSLDLLFARWAGTAPTLAASVGGHGLLSRWRSQG